ncbi:putative Protein ABHD11 [Hypsibius exemplaris]|uniref:sn-1-specific diacylglycerol lipase ABHD11 n=1 Tax=Hypsibius exemplaris TaxID=2072580 RepID=A0A9X6RKZ0_HYPEX|nr:putative Protein ABHD11 [Hypsibius exemplaris]
MPMNSVLLPRIACRSAISGLASLTKFLQPLPTCHHFAVQRNSSKQLRRTSAEHRKAASDAQSARGNHFPSAQLASVTWKPQPTLFKSPKPACPVYMMHGLLGYKEEFAAFGQTIADRTGHAVTAFDARNHGESEHIDGMNYISTGDDMAHYMEANGTKEAIFVAHSMGAGSAISLALRRPDLVTGLLTIDVGVSDAPRKTQLLEFLKSLLKIPLRHGVSLEEGRAAVRKILLAYEVEPFIVEHRVLPNIIEKDGKIQWRINLPIIARDILNLTQAPAGIQFANLVYDKPVAILMGGSSDYIKADDDGLLYRNFPKAKIQRVPDAGHWVHLDQPKVFLEAAVKFINQLTTT